MLPGPNLDSVARGYSKHFVASNIQQHMATATQLTVSDAAAHVGVTRQTIFKQIKSGKLSATKSRLGHLQVNVVELMRVYGELQSPQQVAQNRLNKAQHETTATATVALQLDLERAKLQLEKRDFELEQLRRQMDEMREREREHRNEKHQLLTIIDRQTLLLAAPTPSKAPARSKGTNASSPVVKKAPAKPPTRVAAKPLAKAKPVAAKKTTAKAVKPASKVAARKATR